MGLNMPAKTVVFTDARKFDGTTHRCISSGEYIQMSGRAGRRGLDDRGIVILMLSESIEPAEAKEMIQGEADPLKSSFHLGYNMLLNLLRVEEANPEYMMMRSFHQFQANRSAPQLQQALRAKRDEYNSIHIDNESKVAQYYALRQQVETCRQKLKATINTPVNVIQFLNVGRLVKVVDGPLNYGWGIVINFGKKKLSKFDKKRVMEGNSDLFVVDVLLFCKPSKDSSARGKDAKPRPAKPTSKSAEFIAIPVTLSTIDAVSSMVIHVNKNLTSVEHRKAAAQRVREALKRVNGVPPLLDPVEDMKITDETFLKSVRKQERLEDRLTRHELHKSPSINEDLATYSQKMAVETEIHELEQRVRSASQDVIMLQTLKGMKRVLRRLGHTTADNVIDMKGRIACEISTSDELLATELMFGGVFNNLTPEMTAALCSCLVYSDYNDEQTSLPEEFAAPFQQLCECARRVATVKKDARLDVDVQQYVASIKPRIMELVHAWCKGAKFAEICKMTDVFEGSIVRAMRRLDELLQEFCRASKAIGNTELEQKFKKSIECLKRDIVFAASLYL